MSLAPAVTRSLLLSVCLLATATSPSHAADAFPSKPIRIIVPVAAGGNLDIVTRAMAERLGASMGQPVIVENRVGGSSTVGTKHVARSTPDGYTLLAIGNTFLSVPAILPDAGYDPVGEFVGISLIGRIPNILVVGANTPSRTVQDLIARAKVRPEAISYGSAGSGSVGHFAAEKFSRFTGTKMLHIPYKGGGPALIDVIGGRVDMMFDQVSTSRSHIKAGTLRSLGVSSLTRSPILPDVPTLDELGLKGFEDITINGLLAPVGTPRDVLLRLHAEVVKALQTPALRDRFLEQGIELAPSPTYEDFNTYVKTEVVRYTKLARDANIKAE
jgi:tripartite-type tricarboxylate transporter receptor subunit TctC